MNIILIGMRSAGKSKVSRHLSLMTKRAVLSTDLLIQYDNMGQSIPAIIQNNKGDWRAFRDMEYEVVRKVARLDDHIIDCGGGVIVDLDEDGNEVYSHRKMDLLKRSGTVIWLKGDIHRLAAKVKHDQERPSLDAVRSAEELMHRRLPFYKKAADIVVNIEGKKRRRLAQEIFRRIR